MTRYGPEGTPTTLVASGVRRQVAVTPNDSTDLATGITSGLSVNVAGNVKFLDAADNVVTRAATAGVDYKWEVKRVYSTDTTATGIYALYSQ